jgi:hypothetical protein
MVLFMHELDPLMGEIVRTGKDARIVGHPSKKNLKDFY